MCIFNSPMHSDNKNIYFITDSFDIAFYGIFICLIFTVKGRKKELERKNSQILFVFAGDNQLGWIKQTGHQFIQQNGHDRIEKKKTLFLSHHSPSEELCQIPFRTSNLLHLQEGREQLLDLFFLVFLSHLEHLVP